MRPRLSQTQRGGGWIWDKFPSSPVTPGIYAKNELTSQRMTSPLFLSSRKNMLLVGPCSGPGSQELQHGLGWMPGTPLGWGYQALTRGWQRCELWVWLRQRGL